MLKKWTGNLVGLMHIHQIQKAQLAETLGVTPEYVSMVLNGKRDPAGARERFEAAVKSIIDSESSEAVK